jgi:hypothetical protein
MANAPLNPPTGTNNLLALAASVSATGRGEAGTTDTGEPTLPWASVPAGAVAQTITFPVNSMGLQPRVARGGFALVVKGAAGTTVGPMAVYASDGTAARDELVASIPVAVAGAGMTIVEGFFSSLAAGSDAATITNVTSLKLVGTLAGGAAVIGFAAVGGP